MTWNLSPSGTLIISIMALLTVSPILRPVSASMD
jgi:hypothetical protein